MYLSRDKSFYRLILGIALPIAAANILTFSISMMDSLMVGLLGEVQISGVASANRFFFIFSIILYGITGGSNVLIAQYWGKQEPEAIHKILSIMYRIVLGLVSIFFVIAQLVPEKVISIFATDPEVIREGASYLRAVAWGYPLFAVTNATVIILRAVRTVHISNYIYSASLAINALGNWMLIFGRLGAPRLRVVGAAYATVLARVAEFVIMLIFLWKFEDKLHIRLPKMKGINPLMLQSYLANCLPVIANEAIWVTGSTVVSMIVGRLGTNVIAASNVEGIVWQLVTVGLFGLQNATSVIVGNAIGAGEQHKLTEYTRTLITLGLLVGVLASSLMLLLRPVIGLFYPSFDQATLEIARQLMLNGSMVMTFQALNFVCLMGILRGGGDLRFVLIFDVVFLWLLSIPLGLAAAFWWQWSPRFVLLALRTDEIIKALVSIWRVRSGAWVRDVTINTRES
ncbi:MAG: MATE family efflux transporter [Symbiobacteriaceae bacterium]|nr:MATE family efflux transporter [Symbiobacteriaceae bacterium]